MLVAGDFYLNGILAKAHADGYLMDGMELYVVLPNAKAGGRKGSLADSEIR